MVYIIPIVDLSPSEGFVLSAVTPSGGREPCLGCVAGTLLEAPDDSLVASGLAEAGPPEDPPTTDEEREALVEGKSPAFIEACKLLGYIEG
jgi:hypothetical protein